MGKQRILGRARRITPALLDRQAPNVFARAGGFDGARAGCDTAVAGRAAAARAAPGIGEEDGEPSGKITPRTMYIYTGREPLEPEEGIRTSGLPANFPRGSLHFTAGEEEISQGSAKQASSILAASAH